MPTEEGVEKREEGVALPLEVDGVDVTFERWSRNEGRDGAMGVIEASVLSSWSSSVRSMMGPGMGRLPMTRDDGVLGTELAEEGTGSGKREDGVPGTEIAEGGVGQGADECGKERGTELPGMSSLQVTPGER